MRDITPGGDPIYLFEIVRLTRYEGNFFPNWRATKDVFSLRQMRHFRAQCILLVGAQKHIRRMRTWIQREKERSSLWA
jgi:hypothetical protein